LIDYEGMFGWV